MNARSSLSSVVVAVVVALQSTPAYSNCDEIVDLPMEPYSTKPTDEEVGVICQWRTEKWKPVESCGAFGFEAIGPGTMPVAVSFGRSNSAYTTEWETHSEGDGWSTRTLEPETFSHRCFAGWCPSISYILRTAAPVEEAVCSQKVQLRVRLEERAE
jgi:hypothetical protein